MSDVGTIAERCRQAGDEHRLAEAQDNWFGNYLQQAIRTTENGLYALAPCRRRDAAFSSEFTMGSVSNLDG